MQHPTVVRQKHYQVGSEQTLGLWYGAMGVEHVPIILTPQPTLGQPWAAPPPPTSPLEPTPMLPCPTCELPLCYACLCYTCVEASSMVSETLW